ncbi:hypothetical protein BDA96_01G311400 [Sorghum bicolor]|uniref:Uncharacterized protein n=1 Tax=Sorghum bicolor TaxID=4558 RepID=A0A921V019_SORBI|nr:hypothetical protein BDA96_01G311400 [Sorghum bicolor]
MGIDGDPLRRRHRRAASSASARAEHPRSHSALAPARRVLGQAAPVLPRCNSRRRRRLDFPCISRRRLAILSPPRHSPARHPTPASNSSSPRLPMANPRLLPPSIPNLVDMSPLRPLSSSSRRGRGAPAAHAARAVSVPGGAVARADSVPGCCCCISITASLAAAAASPSRWFT